jgi:uncharacterized protein YbaR (Trm112 family)
MIPSWIFEYIRCPITHERLRLASKSDLDRLHAALLAGSLTNRLGENLQEMPASGMVNESHSWFYPIENDIPSLIADEAIPLSK